VLLLFRLIPRKDTNEYGNVKKSGKKNLFWLSLTGKSEEKQEEESGIRFREIAQRKTGGTE
jgi:hypothetical protein